MNKKNNIWTWFSSNLKPLTVIGSAVSAVVLAGWTFFTKVDGENVESINIGTQQQAGRDINNIIVPLEKIGHDSEITNGKETGNIQSEQNDVLQLISDGRSEESNPNISNDKNFSGLKQKNINGQNNLKIHGSSQNRNLNYEQNNVNSENNADIH